MKISVALPRLPEGDEFVNPDGLAETAQAI